MKKSAQKSASSLSEPLRSISGNNQSSETRSTKSPEPEENSSGLIKRNPGFECDLAWIKNTTVNTFGVRKRAGEIGARRSIKKDQQALWLLGAINLMDLTTLEGDDTPGRVERLCSKALSPLSLSLKKELKTRLQDYISGENVIEQLKVAAVCVYHSQVPEAVRTVNGALPIAAVSTGFPHGQSPESQKIEEILASVRAGASEIDVVISRQLALSGQWKRLYNEIKAYRKACGDAHLKVILETGELGTLENVARASRCAMLAGADFIKTSTGKAKISANLPVSLIMMRQIREYNERTGIKIGFKPAGGISTSKDALAHLAMLREELGTQWVHPGLFRFGASSLLTDIERQLSHYVTGRYARYETQPLG